jgi:hypothetical protein
MYITNNTVLCKSLVQWKREILNSVILQVTEAVSLYSDRDRYRSLTFLDNWPAKHCTYITSITDITDITYIVITDTTYMYISYITIAL